MDAGWTPAHFATLVRRAGKELDQPNGCNAAMVKNWENGELGECHPVYRDALAQVTGVKFNTLYKPSVLAGPDGRLVTMIVRELNGEERGYGQGSH
jgi:hypothetical protein